MSHLDNLSPDAKALLVEIGEQDDSKLLSISPEQVRRSLLGTVPTASESEAFLTRAERQLVRFHRHEVAALLKEWCLIGLAEDPANDGVLFKRRSDGSLSYMEPVECRRETEYVLARVVADPESASASALLRRCCSAGRGPGPSVAQLATACQRLVPADAPRVYVALDLHARGKSHDALFALERLLASETPDTIRSNALWNMGLVLDAVGQTDRVLEANRLSCNYDRGRATPQFSWFMEALKQENREQALRASALLDESCSVEDQVVAEAVSIFSARKEFLDDRTLSKMFKTLQDIERGLSFVALELANAIR